MPESQPEPWLRGTHTEVPPLPRAVIHAIELAQEDISTWCGNLTDEELNATPFGLPSISSQIRHIARSVDRLLTYAEGHPLNAHQLDALATEANPNSSRQELFAGLSAVLTESLARIRVLGENPATLQQSRAVGRKSLPTTVAGLLVHVADHTQRHVGQLITTAKILLEATRVKIDS
jgi:uncharacterized damage-inducible protein DinB